MHEMIRRSGVAAMAIAMALSSVCFNMLPAAAASQSNLSNPANIIQDIGDADIIDTDRTGSIHIYKYDTTSAEASGDYHEGDIKATGQEDTNVSDALSDYAIKGVEFTYLKVGEIETFSNTKAVGDNPGSDIVVVYEIPDELQEILNDEANGHEYLKAEDAYDMSSTGENRDTLSKTCDKRGVKHYTSTQIDDALQQILEDDNIKAKNALEGYLVTYGSQDKTGRQDSAEKQNFSTDSGVLTTASDGTASVDGLPLGLYLIVETKVPEMVTSTVNPWFVTLPFTNTSIQTEEKNGHSSASSTTHTDNGMDSDDNNGGDYWLYDFHAYPKNQTGNPTLDKSVRNSYSVESVTGGKTGRKNNGVDIADTYVSSLAGKTAANAALINDTPDNG